MEGNAPWHCAGNQKKEVKSQEESSNKSEVWKTFKEMISRGGKLLTAEGQLSLLLLSEKDGWGVFFRFEWLGCFATEDPHLLY